MADAHHVIVGLGNPGREYELTRHNLGYLVVQALAQELGLRFKNEPKFECVMASGSYEGGRVDLLLPLTYMNESGRSVAKFLAFYKLEPKDIVVAVDDMALPFGQMRIRSMGSPGGHNGLKSIQNALSTSYYLRLRLGIGTASSEQHIDYVLGQFTSEEKKMLPEYISGAMSCLKRLLKENYHNVANDINRKLSSPAGGRGDRT